MMKRGRHPAVALLVAVVVAVLIVSACGSSAASPSGGSTETPGMATAPATTAASAPSSSSTVPSASSSAAARPTECLEPDTLLALPSDRFTDIRVSTTSDADRLTFVFGDPSLPGPAEPPMGDMEATDPPYTSAGSGAAIQMTGEHVVSVGFSVMSLQNDAGQETYDGPRELRPDLPALKQAVLYDASEGRIGWFVGFDGPGCLAFQVDRDTVTLTIGHP